MTLSLAWDGDTGEETTQINVPYWVERFLEDETDYRVFWLTKGYGSGGTYGACIWHILMCEINYRSMNSWAIGPTFVQVYDTLIPTFAEVLTDVFGYEEGRDYQIIMGGKPELRLLYSGQIIRFKSAGRADLLVGPTISHWIGSEIGLWKSELALQKISTRLRCKKAKRLQGLGESTTEGMNWWEKEANYPQGENAERNSRRIILSTYANKYLKPGYIEENIIKRFRHDPQKLQSYLDGKFRPFTKGSAYWDFRERTAVQLGYMPSTYLPINLAFDFNKKVAWKAIQRQPFRNRRGLTRFKYIELEESSDEKPGLLDALAEFVVKFPPSEWYNVPIQIYGDSSGYAGSHKTPNCDYDQVEQYLRSRYANVHVYAATHNPEVRARLQRINQMFAYDMIIVRPHLRNSIRSYTMTNMIEGQWKIDKPPEDTWSHWGDAGGYFYYQETQHEDFEQPDTPKIYGVNKRL